MYKKPVKVGCEYERRLLYDEPTSTPARETGNAPPSLRHLTGGKIYDSSYGQARHNRARVRIGVGFFFPGLDVGAARGRVVRRTGVKQSPRRSDNGAEIQKHSGLERGARVANAPDDELHQRLARRELRVLPCQDR